jgi:hypothetical protein
LTASSSGRQILFAKQWFLQYEVLICVFIIWLSQVVEINFIKGEEDEKIDGIFHDGPVVNTGLGVCGGEGQACGRAEDL